MKSLVESALENLSTREYFLFRALCGECAAEYGNKKKSFSKAGVQDRQTVGHPGCGGAFELLPHLQAADLQPVLSDLRGSGYVQGLCGAFG